MRTAVATRTRRAPEQQIAELQKQIAAIKTRAAAKKVKQSPTLRHVKAALKSIQKAMAASEDHVLRTALDEARSTLSACMAMKGVLMPVARVEPERSDATPNGAIAPDDLLRYVKRNPGQRSEQISAAIGTDALKLRGTMRKLIDGGHVRTTGAARATAYFPA